MRNSDIPLSSPEGNTETFPIGIIIPTYNRADVLLRCMEHLEAQSWKTFEVIVADDGSTDNTEQAIKRFLRTTKLNLRYIRQPNSGPARARNQAIALLRSPVCLMIGDDILATPNLVAEHLALHQGEPAVSLAGLGLTRWSEQGQTVTAFMRWLDASGMQFAYGDLFRGVSPNWRHFYTSNLSLKTSYLREHTFDEGFRGAAMEDLELGYRLEKRHGLRVAFLPEALAYHLHPTSVAQACRRMVTVGSAASRFDQLWPEHKKDYRYGKLKARLWKLCTDEYWALPILRAAASLSARWRCPNPLLALVFRLHYSRGYLKIAAG